MQVTLTHKLTVLATTLAVAFGMAFTTYAAFDDLEIEVKVYEDKVEVEVEYDDEDKSYSYEDKDLDEAYDELVKDLKDDFDLEITTDDIEDIAEVEHEDDEAEENDDDEDDDRDFCERTKQAAGWGVAKKCVDDEDYELNDKMVKKVERFEDRNMEKYREYGKSTDKTELQNQLRELLLVLVQLLQKQMELQDN